MDKLPLYFIESSAVLTIFYLLYVLVLRKETFFSLNRFFLLGILVFSLLFPFLSFDLNPIKFEAVEQPIQEISKVRMSYYDAIGLWEFRGDGTPLKNVNNATFKIENLWDGKTISFIIFFVIYVTGVITCLSRTIWAFIQIQKMIASNPKEDKGDITVVKTIQCIAPFSFMKYVFVHDQLVNTQEFNQILAHEKTHVQQRHSIDLIFVQLLAAFLWFNPVIWRLIKSLKTIHEYIADNKMIKTGYSLVEYQTLLLSQLISNNSYGLVHNFNLSFIKKRITMMKNNKSGRSGKVRVALAVSMSLLLIITIVQCNAVMEDKETSLSNPTSEIGAGIINIDLPVLPPVLSSSHLTTDKIQNIEIDNNSIKLNGEPVELDNLAGLVQQLKLATGADVMAMYVNKGQTMDLVRDVQTELRRINSLKILYVGITAEGETIESTILLPPLPGSLSSGLSPTIDDEYIARTGIDILYLRMNGNDGKGTQKAVDQFVKKHMAKGSSNYVVSAKFEDGDTYGEYLLNLVHVQEAFNQIYQKRAQDMFGMNWFDFDKSKLEEKEQYLAVKDGIPRAISIAER